MNRGLAALLRLRRLELDSARRALAAAVAAEVMAEQRLVQARAAPRLEASRLPDNAPADMRNFTAWLPHATAAMQSAEAALQAASRLTAAARAALGDRQAACKAVETLVEHAMLTAQKQQVRREGYALEDTFRGRRK